MNTRLAPPADQDREGDAGVWIGLRLSHLGPAEPGPEPNPDPSASIAGPDLQETYGWMAGLSDGRPTDRFDIHALASIFTIALVETDWGRTAPLAQALGLSFDDAVATVVNYFPHALVEIGPVLGHLPIERAEDETSLLDLLWRSVVEPGELGGRLAKILARRAQRPGALWQALGLRNRGELSTLMSRHFPELARRNARDIQWKAYLYRNMCRDADYALCTAPSCLDCEEFFLCFGDESDEGRPTRAVARLRAHAAAA